MLVGATGTTRKYTVPGTAVKGDTLVIWHYIETTGIVFSVAGGGWEKRAQTKQTSEGWEAVCLVLPNWNGTTTEYTLEWGGGSKYNAGSIVVAEGADTASPVNAQSGANFKENASSKNAVVDGPTTTSDENLLISGAFNDNGSSATPGSGWTEDGDQADSPHVAHKNEAVNKGAQSSVTHSLGTASISLTLMLALQPPQSAAKRRRIGSVG